jgi:N-acetylmuramoyl-L-alanine amidase
MTHYYLKVIALFIIILLIFHSNPVSADLPLQGKTIVIDAGHGGLDPGTTYKNIYEKDINLNIALNLEKYLSSYGATVILTRSTDADLSGGVKNHRKKADFDARINIINQEYNDLYLSIHLNYLGNSTYYGAQVFYDKDNLDLANFIQNYLNEHTKTNRVTKKIPTSTYMYERLTTPGILIECGFLSNQSERNKLITAEYQEEFASILSKAIVKYYN